MLVLQLSRKTVWLSVWLCGHLETLFDFLNSALLFLVVNFTTKISALKFPFYDLYFSGYAPKTNLEPNLGAKMWQKKFCEARRGGTFNLLFLAPNCTRFCKASPLPQKCSMTLLPGLFCFKTTNIFFKFSLYIFYTRMVLTEKFNITFDIFKILI